MDKSGVRSTNTVNMSVEEKLELLAHAAIKGAKARGFHGAHVIKSGFNTAVRRLGLEPKEATEILVMTGKFQLRQAGSGVLIYLAEDAPQGPDQDDSRADALFKQAGLSE